MKIFKHRLTKGAKTDKSPPEHPFWRFCQRELPIFGSSHREAAKNLESSFAVNRDMILLSLGGDMTPLSLAIVGDRLF